MMSAQDYALEFENLLHIRVWISAASIHNHDAITFLQYHDGLKGMAIHRAEVPQHRTLPRHAYTKYVYGGRLSSDQPMSIYPLTYSSPSQ